MTNAPDLSRALRWTWPAATAAAALAADLLPLAAGPAPLFSLCLVYAWALRAPDLLPAPAVFLLGLALDGLAGAPLGLTALPLLLVHAATGAARRPLQAASFPVVWAGFVLAALLGCGTRWLIACLWWWHPFAVGPLLAEAMLTLAAYPLVGWPLRHRHARPHKARHAAGG